jgi:hypothetical protein
MNYTHFIVDNHHRFLKRFNAQNTYPNDVDLTTNQEEAAIFTEEIANVINSSLRKRFPHYDFVVEKIPPFALFEGVFRGVFEGKEISNIGQRFFSANEHGKDQTKGKTGETWYKIIGYAYTTEEAQEKLRIL